MMKGPLFALFALVTVLLGERQIATFSKPEGFPVSVRLSHPAKNVLHTSRKQEDGVETITFKIDDDRAGGLLAEVIDAKGKRLWHHDFGYNFSSQQGCSVSAAFHPKERAVILQYHGYKWDHAAKLLFIQPDGATWRVTQYPEHAPEVATALRQHGDYAPELKYSITPSHFDGERVVFSCIPLSPPEAQAPHPFAQGHQFIKITMALGENFALTPDKPRPSEGN